MTEPTHEPAPESGHEEHSSGGVLGAIRETAIIVIAALVISAIVRAFLVQAFYVPSGSMENTLLISDRIIASKISTRVAGVNRGEIVVFTDPGGWLPEPEPGPGGLRGALRSGLTFIGLLPADSGKDLVKRVIGVGGDRVQCCDAQGRILVNGVPLDEPYIIGPTDQVPFDVTVPADSIFVMGDNRGNSRDSRFHLEVASGTVPAANVVGRVVAVVWPFNRLATDPVPEVFGSIPSP